MEDGKKREGKKVKQEKDECRKGRIKKTEKRTRSEDGGMDGQQCGKLQAVLSLSLF